MDFVYQADIWMAHLEGALQFRRKQAAKAGFSRLNGNALVSLSVMRLVHHAHPALANLANNFKTFGDDFARMKWFFEIFENEQRLQQKIAHPLFPFQSFRSLLVELGIVVTSDLQKRLPLL